jgi:hypothetical protein
MQPCAATQKVFERLVLAPGPRLQRNCASHTRSELSPSNVSSQADLEPARVSLEHRKGACELVPIYGETYNSP